MAAGCSARNVIQTIGFFISARSLLGNTISSITLAVLFIVTQFIATT